MTYFLFSPLDGEVSALAHLGSLLSDDALPSDLSLGLEGSDKEQDMFVIITRYIYTDPTQWIERVWVCGTLCMLDKG